MTLTHWTLAKTLKRRGLTAHALVGASGLSKTTVYAIVNGKAQGVTLETVDKLLSGLERLCGEQVRVSEVLEREEEHPYAALLAQTLPYVGLDRAEQTALAADWTPAEREADEAFWQQREAQARAEAQANSRQKQIEAIMSAAPASASKTA